MSSKVNLEGIMLFEQPFARVPFENYRKIFRTSQKNLERDLTAVQSSANELSAKGTTGSLSNEDALNSIDAMIGKVEGLKKKLSDLHETAGTPTQEVMRERLHHLATVESLQNTNETEFSRWADTRLDRWLVDWCLRSGKEGSAKSIAKEKGIETLVDIDLFSDIRRIEEALSKHSCTEALAWCNENKAALRKAKSTLEFELRMQEYIELSRKRKTIEAIAYSRKHLVSWQDTHLAQIRQLSALLAFPPNTLCGPYKRLYDPSRWGSLAKNFRFAIYNLNTLSTEPLLHLSLYAGLVALKLPQCFDHATKNVDCPVCDGESASESGPQPLGLGKLAREVPYSHHANSTIVCRLTGKIMDADNMPLAFPNGYVYSREALEDMAARNNGIVTCRTTGDTCEFRKLKKVFIP
ncbi:CTLH/CRA C-terminal to lish motif domain-containing protein [Crepidotus variabilis]|uniref:CTLH/CRA C-terminal to lish motif domain-containing protein n=1 Tax=Crepidotus variabilis TaxID=179855 RepID=A0A9P6EJH5_9AGAR|nr:CTLH/CRA C-terminal to lish motif domain-containing protein [Crepidotus variabilis]